MENENKRVGYGAKRVIKLILFSIALCAVMTAAFALYVYSVPDKIAELAAEGDMKNTLWLVRYVSYILPIIITTTVLTICYKFSYVKVDSQKDKAKIIFVLICFTYAVLLPLVCLYQSSGASGWNEIVSLGEDGTTTVFALIIGWLLAQIIPLAITLLYHLTRASSEKKELEENEA